MPDAPRILGQSIPAANTLTTLYTVPGATSVVISTLVICNQSNQPANFRVSVAISGAANDLRQYVYFDEIISSMRAFPVTCGWTLATTDVVRVQSSNGLCSFNLFGAEIT